MKKTLLLLCLIILMFSCKKNKPDEPTAESASSTGVITGSIDPVGVATEISLVNDLGTQHFPLIVDPQTGKFNLENLTPGKYLLSIYPGGYVSYNNIIGLNVEVIRGKVTDSGSFQLVSKGTSQPALSGRLLPEGFGTAVNATERTTGRVYTVIPNGYGSFYLPLADGDYTISFATKSPLESPDDIKVSLAGKPVSLGNVTAKEGNSGTLTGKLTPVYAADSVMAANKQTGKISKGTLDVFTGIFSIPGLIPDNYELSVTARVPYLPPAKQSASVEIHKTTDMGLMTLPYNNDVKYLTYKVNGYAYNRYNWPCNFTGSNFSFSLTNLDYRPILPTIPVYINSTLALNMGNISGIGKYALTGKDGANLTLTDELYNSYNTDKLINKWTVSPSAPLGQLEITAIDVNARTMKGTFSGTLIADKPGVANKVITEGSFYFKY